MPSSDEFKRLQRLWYKKLKDSGFDDIEDLSSSRELLKSWHASYFQSRYDPAVFEAKQEYYRKAGIFLHSYPFECRREEEIWRLHCDGYSIRQIERDMKARRFKIYKDKIDRTIARLTKIMFHKAPPGPRQLALFQLWSDNE